MVHLMMDEDKEDDTVRDNVQRASETRRRGRGERPGKEKKNGFALTEKRLRNVLLGQKTTRVFLNLKR